LTLRNVIREKSPMLTSVLTRQHEASGYGRLKTLDVFGKE
jgi:hypothetical protein